MLLTIDKILTNSLLCIGLCKWLVSMEIHILRIWNSAVQYVKGFENSMGNRFTNRFKKGFKKRVRPLGGGMPHLCTRMHNPLMKR